MIIITLFTGDLNIVSKCSTKKKKKIDDALV
jgi:hypothetical protein